jgi:hypothetical protein
VWQVQRPPELSRPFSQASKQECRLDICCQRAATAWEDVQAARQGGESSEIQPILYDYIDSRQRVNLPIKPVAGRRVSA